MKKIFALLLVIMCGFSATAQSAGEALAGRVAQKMADSLALSAYQKTQIYQINMQLHSRKLVARQQYSSGDSLIRQIQMIENTRDSLYRPVLTEEKYLLYKQKKAILISNN
jgi:hypothetical protein